MLISNREIENYKKGIIISPKILFNTIHKTLETYDNSSNEYPTSKKNYIRLYYIINHNNDINCDNTKEIMDKYNPLFFYEIFIMKLDSKQKIAKMVMLYNSDSKEYRKILWISQKEKIDIKTEYNQILISIINNNKTKNNIIKNILKLKSTKLNIFYFPDNINVYEIELVFIYIILLTPKEKAKICNFKYIKDFVNYAKALSIPKINHFLNFNNNKKEDIENNFSQKSCYDYNSNANDYYCSKNKFCYNNIPYNKKRLYGNSFSKEKQEKTMNVYNKKLTNKNIDNNSLWNETNNNETNNLFMFSINNLLDNNNFNNKSSNLSYSSKRIKQISYDLDKDNSTNISKAYYKRRPTSNPITNRNVKKNTHSFLNETYKNQDSFYINNTYNNIYFPHSNIYCKKNLSYSKYKNTKRKICQIEPKKSNNCLKNYSLYFNNNNSTNIREMEISLNSCNSTVSNNKNDYLCNRIKNNEKNSYYENKNNKYNPIFNNDVFCKTDKNRQIIKKRVINLNIKDISCLDLENKGNTNTAYNQRNEGFPKYGMSNNNLIGTKINSTKKNIFSKMNYKKKKLEDKPDGEISLFL